MANWQRTLRMNPEWDQCQNGEITRQALAASIARKLTAMRPLESWEAEEVRQELAEAFEDFGRDTDLSEDEFNSLMSDLYDWGDTSLDGHWNGKKVCWVDCMTEVEQTDRAPVREGRT